MNVCVHMKYCIMLAADCMCVKTDGGGAMLWTVFCWETLDTDVHMEVTLTSGSILVPNMHNIRLKVALIVRPVIECINVLAEQAGFYSLVSVYICIRWIGGELYCAETLSMFT